MFWNFIRGTFRNIAAHKTFTIINILGLAIGVTCALVISLYLLHETGYDKFHSNYERIFRVTVRGKVKDVRYDGAVTSRVLGRTIQKEIEEVEEVTRLARFGAWLVTKDSIRYNEDGILFAHPNFFSFFDGFEVLKGDKETWLAEPKTIVLTESSALKYFSSTDILGEELLLEAGDKIYTVTGVIKDIPSNSHIRFDMMASLVTYQKHHNIYWANNNIYNYIKIREGVGRELAEEKINEFVPKYILPEFEKVLNMTFSEDDEYRYELQPLEMIHLHSSLEAELEQNGKAVYVYSFGIVAILILLIACFNFMNLSSANSVKRSQEVVLRKVSGAGRRLLILQFLVESVVFSLFALIIALLLAEMILPSFNRYFDLNLEFNFFKNFHTVFWILLFAVAVGIVAGVYPAFFISSFQPVKVLHGKLAGGLKNKTVRSVFVVMQFFISVLIIILTIVIYSQVQFMMKKDLGFENEYVIVIRRSDALKEDMENFKKDILENQGVKTVTNSNSIPGRGFVNNTFKLIGAQTNTSIMLNQIHVNYDYCEAYDLEVVQGRFFDPMVPEDSFACVINESAAKLMELTYPVGTKLEHPVMYKKRKKQYTVIGMVKDFHYQPLDKPVQPLVIFFMPGNWEGFVNVRISPKNMKKTIAFIEETWNKYTPDYPFVYFDMKKDFNRSYYSQQKLGRIFLVFSVLAVFVANLGLFGLISFVTSQRVREIGVRKALGASVMNLVVMLSKETFKLVFIASFLACGVAYVVARYWLGGFYYHINLSVKYFVAAALLVLILAQVTVFIKTYYAARKEPGESLKYE